MYHSGIKHHFASRGKPFLVLAQATVMTKPGSSPLHHPSFRNHRQAWLLISAFEGFSCPTKLLLDVGDQCLTCKGTVDPKEWQARPSPEIGVHTLPAGSIVGQNPIDHLHAGAKCNEKASGLFLLLLLHLVAAIAITAIVVAQSGTLSCVNHELTQCKQLAGVEVVDRRSRFEWIL